MKPAHLDLFRKGLKVGNLYYIHERMRLKSVSSDSVVLWKLGPDLNENQIYKDSPVGNFWMNLYNPFMLLEIREDSDLATTFWYKVITKDGIVGWFAIDDEDMKLLHLSFREAVVPSE